MHHTTLRAVPPKVDCNIQYTFLQRFTPLLEEFLYDIVSYYQRLVFLILV